MARNPDYIMMGAWSFKDEIMRLFRGKMGYQHRFIIPLPMPQVVDELRTDVLNG